MIRSKPSGKYTEVCPHSCKLSAAAIGEVAAQALIDAREAGRGQPALQTLAAELGHPVSSAGVMARHLKHWHLADSSPAAAAASEGRDLTDLEILDAGIRQGVKSMHTWRVGPADTIRMLELRFKMGGKSAYQDMEDAMAAASVDSGEVEFEAENPDALDGDGDETGERDG